MNEDNFYKQLADLREIVDKTISHLNAVNARLSVENRKLRALMREVLDCGDHSHGCNVHFSGCDCYISKIQKFLDGVAPNTGLE